MAANTLKVGISDLSYDDCSERRRIQFVIEQLKLMSTSKFARHYTPQMTVMAYMLHAASAELDMGPFFLTQSNPKITGIEADS